MRKGSARLLIDGSSNFLLWSLSFEQLTSDLCPPIWVRWIDQAGAGLSLGKIINWPFKGIKNHINNTLALAKRWPRPLNRGGR